MCCFIASKENWIFNWRKEEFLIWWKDLWLLITVMGNFLQKFSSSADNSSDYPTPQIVDLTPAEIDLIKETWKIPCANVRNMTDYRDYTIRWYSSDLRNWIWLKLCGKSLTWAQFELICSQSTRLRSFSTHFWRNTPKINRNLPPSRTNRSPPWR